MAGAKSLAIARGCVAAALVMLLVGCDNEPKVWITVKDEYDNVLCKAGIFVPPPDEQPIALGTEQPYGMAVTVPEYSGIKGTHVGQYLENRRVVWNAPSQGTGDFTINWTEGPRTGCPLYWQWVVGSDPVPDMEPLAYEWSQGSSGVFTLALAPRNICWGNFTPPSIRPFTNPGFNTDTFRVWFWITIHTWGGYTAYQKWSDWYYVQVQW